MAKQKTIPELEAEKAENERKITQLQHNCWAYCILCLQLF